MIHSRLYCTLLCITALSAHSFAQEMFHTSPLQIQTAGIYSTSPFEESVDAFNPSIISEIKSFGAQVSCSIPYALKELCQVDAKVATSTPICHLQAEVFRAGNENSSFTTVGGGISRRFHKFGIGMEYRLLVHNQANTEKYTSSFSRVGMHVNLNDEWTIAMAVQNIEGRKLNYKHLSVDIPSFFVLGLRWNHGVMVFQSEVEKNWVQNAVVKVAVSVVSERVVFGSLGLMVKDNIASPSVGVGAKSKYVLVNAGMSYHNHLGISSGASLAVVNIW